MKIAVVCSSKTGNTRMVAHALADAFDAPLFTPQNAPQNLADFDTLLLGFWCDKGRAPEDMENFVQKIHGKRLGFFATLGGDSESERAKEWFAKTIDELLNAGKENSLLASFLCRGRIDSEIYQMMIQMMGGAETDEQKARWQQSKTHPDREDLINAVDVFSKVLKG